MPTVEAFELVVYERLGPSLLGAPVGSSSLSFSKTDTGAAHHNFAPADIYEFDAVLDSRIALTAGEYWLSLESLAPDGDPFVWERSAGTAPIGLFIYPSATPATAGIGDFALVLEGDAAPVPLPMPGALLLGGLLALAAWRHAPRA